MALGGFSKRALEGVDILSDRVAFEASLDLAMLEDRVPYRTNALREDAAACNTCSVVLLNRNAADIVAEEGPVAVDFVLCALHSDECTGFCGTG